MGKIGKLTIWFLFAIGLKICKSSVFQINKNSTLYSNGTSSGNFSQNETSIIETFQNSSTGDLVVWTETPKHHKVKRSILVYKQKTLKIQVPDAPLYINSGPEGTVGEKHGMPISLMLKSPEHSLETIPYLIKALKEKTQHVTDNEKPQEYSYEIHRNTLTMSPPINHHNKDNVNPVNRDKDSLPVPVNREKESPPVIVKGGLPVPAKHHTNDQHPQWPAPSESNRNQYTNHMENEYHRSPDSAKIKSSESYHPPKRPTERQFPSYPDDHRQIEPANHHYPDDHRQIEPANHHYPDNYRQMEPASHHYPDDHRQIEPASHYYPDNHRQIEPASHHYPMHPNNDVNVVTEKRVSDVQDSLMDRVGPERIPPGIEEPVDPGSQWHAASPKDFDTIKKETSNMISKQLMDNNKLADPLKQSLEKKDESADLIPESLEDPKLDLIQDLANGAMNFQSIKFVKNSWILPPVNKRNPPTSMENGDFRQNPYNNDQSVPLPPSHTNTFNNNPGYETKREQEGEARGDKEAESRNYKPNPDPSTRHGGPGDRYVLMGTEEPEMSFDDKGNLLFLKKQTLEILVPKFLMNYTQEIKTTTSHYEPIQQYPENYKTYPTGNPVNKMPRASMKYFPQNERDKDYFIRRYLNKRRANRDIKATFWHNRGLEDQLIPKTSRPTEKQR